MMYVWTIWTYGFIVLDDLEPLISDCLFLSDVVAQILRWSVQILDCRMVGHSDWTSATITVWVPNGFEAAAGSTVHQAVASHLSVLFTHVFTGAKPAKAAQARWTGVASVCAWCLGLGVFHNMLAPILAALAGGSKPETDMRTANDVDARTSDWFRSAKSVSFIHERWFETWWIKLTFQGSIPSISSCSVTHWLYASPWRRWFFMKYYHGAHGHQESWLEVLKCQVPGCGQVQTADSEAYRAQQSLRRARLSEWSGPGVLKTVI